MSFFDRFIPGRKRVKAIEQQNEMLKGAVNVLTRTAMSGGSKWPYGLSNSGRISMLSHYTARRNARDTYQDSVEARTVVNRKADIVAGVGLKLESTPDAEILGITEDQAEKWGHNVDQRFDLWCRDKRAHRSETMTPYQSHHLYQKFKFRDNDIFVRLYYDDDPTLLNPLQFEFLDPDQIRGDAYTSTSGPQCNIDGINRDERGREKSYKVWVKDENNGYKEVEIPRVLSSGRIAMLHGFDIEYAGQGRGYSKLAYAVQEFENITDFKLSQIKKAISQSQFWGFVTPSKDEDATNPFEGIMTNYGAGPAAEMFGSNPSPPSGAQNVTAESLEPVTCYEIPEATSSVPGSAFIGNLRRGQGIDVVKNTAPSESFNSFVDGFFSYLSADSSMPIEATLMKFSQNFSASRGALLLCWQAAEIDRQDMAADYLDHIFKMWLSEEIAAGRITAPGWSNPVYQAAWLKHNWIGDPPPDIDPSKISKARKDNIEMGITNIDRESRNYNGSSAKANKAKLTKELAGMPLVPWSKGGGNGSATAILGEMERLAGEVDQLKNDRDEIIS